MVCFRTFIVLSVQSLVSTCRLDRISIQQTQALTDGAIATRIVKELQSNFPEHFYI